MKRDPVDIYLSGLAALLSFGHNETSGHMQCNGKISSSKLVHINEPDLP